MVDTWFNARDKHCQLFEIVNSLTSRARRSQPFVLRQVLVIRSECLSPATQRPGGWTIRFRTGAATEGAISMAKKRKAAKKSTTKRSTKKKAAKKSTAKKRSPKKKGAKSSKKRASKKRATKRTPSATPSPVFPAGF
jgi:hypothetical protein